MKRVQLTATPCMIPADVCLITTTLVMMKMYFLKKDAEVNITSCYLNFCSKYIWSLIDLVLIFFTVFNPADVCECSSPTDTCCVSNSSMCKCKDGWTGRKCSTGKRPWPWGQSVFGKKKNTGYKRHRGVSRVTTYTFLSESHFSFTFSLNSESLTN